MVHRELGLTNFRTDIGASQWTNFRTDIGANQWANVRTDIGANQWTNFRTDILLRWWRDLMVQGSADEAAVLLESANHGVSFSDVRVGASHGKPFEKQLAYLWRILMVTDAIWRSEQPGARRPRTILGMLGKDCMTSTGDVSAM
jgi:hypothetical protein